MSTRIDTQSRKSVLPDQSTEDSSGLREITFLRLPQVKATTGLSKTTIYEKIKNNDFPCPVQISKRAVGWVESEVRQWAAKQVSARMLGGHIIPVRAVQAMAKNA